MSTPTSHPLRLAIISLCLLAGLMLPGSLHAADAPANTGKPYIGKEIPDNESLMTWFREFLATNVDRGYRDRIHVVLGKRTEAGVTTVYFGTKAANGLYYTDYNMSMNMVKLDTNAWIVHYGQITALFTYGYVSPY